MKLFDNKLEQLKPFHLCGAPGMFIIGMNHYIKTKTHIKMKGMAIVCQMILTKTALGDEVGLIKNKDKLLVGPKW